LYGNSDKWTRQTFHVVLAETTNCCAKRRTIFLGLTFIASRDAPTTSFRTDALLLRPFARLSHTNTHTHTRTVPSNCLVIRATRRESTRRYFLSIVICKYRQKNKIFW
jgi:hypothetical protein